MCRTLIAISAILLLIIWILGCSSLRRIAYCPDINQGNYFTPNDISRIHIGMTQQQVVYVLGTPMMIDPFSTNVWFYVFRQQFGHKEITQKMLTLTFDGKGILTSIDKNLTRN